MSKYTGRGGIFRIGTAGPTPTYSDVAQVSSIGSIDIQSDEVEVTTLDNTSGFREFLQTFKDAGELPITLVWDPDLPTHGETAEGLWGLFVSGEVRPMQIEFPTKPAAYLADFDGFVKGFPTPQLTPDDALTAEVAIRVSGTVTLSKAGAPLGTGFAGAQTETELTPEQRKQAEEMFRRQLVQRRGGTDAAGAVFPALLSDSPVTEVRV